MFHMAYLQTFFGNNQGEVRGKNKSSIASSSRVFPESHFYELYRNCLSHILIKQFSILAASMFPEMNMLLLEYSFEHLFACRFANSFTKLEVVFLHL